jgi:hypothetical protein
MTEVKDLAGALAAVQAELPRVGKGNTAQVRSDKGNYSYKYADLADVSSAILPLLGKHGLSFTSMPTLIDGAFVLEYRLMFPGDQSLIGIYPLPSTGSPQSIGSAITYARRYALCAVTGIAPDGDDDGKSATEQYEAANEEDQQFTFDAFAAEIEHTRTVESLTDTAKAIRRSAGGKHISKNHYDRLVKLGAARRAELDQPQTLADVMAEQADQ